MLLAVIRKRRFLGIRRQGCGGLAEFETKVIEISNGHEVGLEFLNDQQLKTISCPEFHL